MVNTMKLKGKMRECDVTQAALAKQLGVTERTMSSRLNQGIFKTSEIDKIAIVLNLTQAEATEIFFAK